MLEWIQELPETLLIDVIIAVTIAVGILTKIIELVNLIRSDRPPSEAPDMLYLKHLESRIRLVEQSLKDSKKDV